MASGFLLGSSSVRDFSAGLLDCCLLLEHHNLLAEAFHRFLLKVDAGGQASLPFLLPTWILHVLFAQGEKQLILLHEGSRSCKKFVKKAAPTPFPIITLHSAAKPFKGI